MTYFNDNNDNEEYDKFLDNYFKLSWKFAKHYMEYDNYINEYHLLKNNILKEYIDYYISQNYSYDSATELAYRYIHNSKRLKQFTLENKNKKDLKNYYGNEYKIYFEHYIKDNN